MTGLLLAAGLCGYAYYQESKKLKAVAFAAIHAGAQWLALAALTYLFAELNMRILSAPPPTWSWFGLLGLELVPFGAVIGGFIFGLNLLLSCLFLGLNNNDAFSSMRLNTHRHFLRLRITQDLIIYPIRLDQIPHRSDWRKNTGAHPQHLFVPTEDLKPGMIELPIVIDPKTVTSTREVTATSTAPSKPTE